MRALLWRDLRQNRNVLIAVGVFVLIPYMILLCFGLVESLRSNTAWEGYFEGRQGWSGLCLMASTWSLGMSVLAVAFIAGNMVAGERADRSAEFAAYLPISRRSSIASKATLAIGAYLLVWIVNLLIVLLTYQAPPGAPSKVGQLFAFMGVTATLIFGVAWLLSCLTSSPGISAAAGIAAWIAVAGTLVFADYVRELDARDPGSSYEWYVPLCLVFGAGCFVAGVVYYLRRVEA